MIRAAALLLFALPAAAHMPDTRVIDGDTVVVPTPARACRRCGHAHQAHGQDPRDTSCTDCPCIEWAEQEASAA